MKREKITQVALSKMLGTSQGTINRWLKNVHSISGPEQKLLSYLIHGELPFPAQKAKEGMYLDFSADEFAIIQVLARREGYACAEDWIAAKIRAYLAMTNTAPPVESLRVATDEKPYIFTRKS